MKQALLATGAALVLAAGFIAPAGAQATRGGPGGGGGVHAGGGGGAHIGGGGGVHFGGGGGFRGGGGFQGGGAFRGGGGAMALRGNPGTGAGSIPHFNGGHVIGNGRVRTGHLDGRHFRGRAFGFVPGPFIYGDGPYYSGDDSCYELQPVQTQYGVQYRRVWVCD